MKIAMEVRIEAPLADTFRVYATPAESLKIFPELKEVIKVVGESQVQTGDIYDLKYLLVKEIKQRIYITEHQTDVTSQGNCDSDGVKMKYRVFFNKDGKSTVLKIDIEMRFQKFLVRVLEPLFAKGLSRQFTKRYTETNRYLAPNGENSVRVHKLEVWGMPAFAASAVLWVIMTTAATVGFFMISA